jgi:ABC-type antimicrobial peptide transport system permease subunit
MTEFHHADSKNIFYGKGIPFGMPRGIRSAFPQVEQVAPLYASRNDQLVIPESSHAPSKKFKEETGVFFAEPSFFRVFDFPLLAGSYASLSNPGNVLLSKETAEKYFGNWNNAIGKTIRMNNDIVLSVSGVLASIPANTDFQLKAVIAYGTGYTRDLKTSTNYDGVDAGFGCYILLPQTVNAAAFEKQMRAYSVKVKSPDDKDQLTLQPLSAVHFDTQAGTFSGNGISRTMIRILWMIAAFILLIACVNFVNLATAQAVNRAKEVGVRKVLGSRIWQLRTQFLTETFLIVLGSVLLGLLLARLALPYAGSMLELTLKMNAAHSLSLLLFLLAVLFIVTGVAGFYPSVVLSRFNPIHAFKSRLTAKSNKGVSLRRGLVVFQFMIAQALIIGTLVIVKQMDYFVSQPVGFDKDAIVNIPLPADSLSQLKYNFVKTRLQNIKGIQHVSFSSNTPIEDNDDMWSTFIFDHAEKRTDFYAIVKLADNEYVPTYRLPLVAGRNMEPSDTMREVLVNEMLVKNLGFTNPHDALNKEIAFNGKVKGAIVGVLKDFNTRSFRDDLAPLIIATLKNNYRQVSVKFSTKDVLPVMRSIGQLWNSAYPDFVYEYQFLDDKIAGFYKQESQLAYLYKVFAGIAIFLSCLGLYGLASFMAVQRVKEVGIRKVLGATASGIVYLFSREFILLIALAFAIAAPVTWYFMNQWLQHFSFRITLSWWLFLAGGITSILIALASVGFQAIKAALANPIAALRNE